MARAATIGNGNLLVGIDDYGHVRDLYFPFAGYANHISGASGSYTHRIGVWVEENFSWLSDDAWHIRVGVSNARAMSDIIAVNDDLGIEIHITDAVHNEKNIFLRDVVVKNTHKEEREVKIFFAQEFRISESRRGDTAYFDPRPNAIIHYKGHIAFLINAVSEGERFSEYSIGLFDIEGKNGTHVDAENGRLSNNPIEHGSVDSVIGLNLKIGGESEKKINYWIVAGRSIEEVHELNGFVLLETPDSLVRTTENYWKAWLDKDLKDLSIFDADLINLYKQSLSIIRVHSDNGGGIIASSDSDMLNQGRDTYSYVWPRDGALIAHALDRAGYIDVARRFFSFMSKRIEDDGYLMHKYSVDGALGSSWHPWIRNGVEELPIQEDETALVLYMLGKHYEFAHDLEFIESLYNPFIEPAADFMCEYIDEDTGLPKGSYDLWEEKYGTSTYTASAVYGALNVATDLAVLLGKRESAKRYRNVAEKIHSGILGYLFDPKMGMFVKLLRHDNNKFEFDRTIDMSSFHGVLFFDVLIPEDKRISRAAEVINKYLAVPTQFGGYMRYEDDGYYRTKKDAPPNAWCITTLWMAQYKIKIAKTRKEMKEAYGILRWVYDRARRSGVLPEQIHPYTGAHLSAAPLVWSHAEFVITMDEYIKKYNSL